MSESQHTIAGTVLTMPVRVRKAEAHNAMFSVSADAAQKLIDYSGLQVCQHRPGRAIVNVGFVQYLDCDLGQYNEFATCVMVNPPGSNARGLRGLGDAGAFVQHMPVDQTFTLEAGRQIWGYPKIMADFTVRDGGRFGFDVSADGALIASMEFGRGLPIPGLSRAQQLKTYTYVEGSVHETRAIQRPSGMSARIGGAMLRLGDHPIAKELASLGLPKRALATMSVANVEMTFGDAQVID